MSFGGGGGGGGAINTATDTEISTPTANHILVYNGNNADNKWENKALAGTVALANGGGVENVSTNSSASGTVTLNLVDGNVFNITMIANVTFVFSGATSGKACSFGLYLNQDTTGSWTVTWPAGVKWAGGTPPTLTATASATDLLVFESIDGGTTWCGSLVGANFS